MVSHSKGIFFTFAGIVFFALLGICAIHITYKDAQQAQKEYSRLHLLRRQDPAIIIPGYERPPECAPWITPTSVRIPTENPNTYRLEHRDTINNISPKIQVGKSDLKCYFMITNLDKSVVFYRRYPTNGLTITADVPLGKPLWAYVYEGDQYTPKCRRVDLHIHFPEEIEIK